MRKKVTAVGGGFVGSTMALRIIGRGLAGVVLTDIFERVPARSQREPRVRAVLGARAIRSPGCTCSPGNTACGLYLQPVQ